MGVLLVIAACGGHGAESHDAGAPATVAGSGGAAEAAGAQAAAAGSGGNAGTSEPAAGGAGAPGAGPAAPGDGGAEPALDAGPQAPTEPPDLQHTFETVTVAPGEERTGLCQSWTIGNDQPLFVNRVVAHNQGAFHHSNWIWVDDQSYPGPDGTWPCADRGFDQILAAAVGGVFFAQSTQSRTDTQQFPEGVAFELPPGARLIGDVHLLNPSDAPVSTDLSFDVYTLPPEQVRVKLQPMAFTNLALEVTPGESRARLQCSVPVADFDVYYVLPHFHSSGTSLRIDVAGGPMDGANVFTSEGGYGEALGEVFDPPIRVAGAAGLVMTCDYRNTTSQTLAYGFGGQEMCVVLIYSTGGKAGGMGVNNLTVADVGGVHTTDALCLSVGVPP